ncbi:MAG: molecular chaperone TorD family protein [Melioribacteraceae bacterium]
MNEREIIYKTFAKLFNYPDDELIEWIKSGVIAEFLELIEMEEAKIEERNQWNKLNSKSDLLEVLQVEYTHLFISSFPTIPAPLYKSFYEDNEIMGSSIESLIDTYEKYGFEVSKTSNELPDNLVLQFEFASLLIKDNVPLDEQYSFISEFILSWTEKLEEKIIENANLDFYKDLLVTINKFLNNDIATNNTKLSRAEL